MRAQAHSLSQRGAESAAATHALRRELGGVERRLMASRAQLARQATATAQVRPRADVLFGDFALAHAERSAFADDVMGKWGLGCANVRSVAFE
eukprot:1014585-Pleurochrysis_carterae.AAC.1